MNRLPSAAWALPRNDVGAIAGIAPGQGRELAWPAPVPSPGFRFTKGSPRVAIVSNPRSRRNQTAELSTRVAPGMLAAAPTTPRQLADTLASFAAQRIDLLVIDGGDGTVRDVLTAAGEAFGDALPPLAVLPSGKTNALAFDLGIPLEWSPADAQEALAAGKVQTRPPIEIVQEDGTMLRGFLFGAGGFVRATELAQHAHRLGAFGNLAVGLSVAGALAQSLVGGKANPWRAGERVGVVNLVTGETSERDLYLLFGSTLERLPLGLRPLGRTAPGLDILAIDAPPRLLPIAAPAILAGLEGEWLQRLGYHHCHATPAFAVSLKNGFILDGELFAGGNLSVRTGAPIRFVTP
ncbi:diacylglycerol/lipid kinase family protein [Sphingomonas aracearum]|uniref:Diacylglycerol kinase n=1 Tax=Sphingomonas aracearum TaxID=2283317 RepID=A0A369VVL5_9SPHN|nr:acylglycerol kinase family protein [Sphingomonas aracearum]RDE05685.1 diacylglycerol kinase [Sphingomonas aracearum]